MTPIALGPCGPVDTVTLDGAAFFVRSSRPHSPAAARKQRLPVLAASSSPEPAPPSVHPAAAPAEGSGAASSVSEVGPDRVVDTGWGKTRPR